MNKPKKSFTLDLTALTDKLLHTKSPTLSEERRKEKDGKRKTAMKELRARNDAVGVIACYQDEWFI